MACAVIIVVCIVLIPVNNVLLKNSAIASLMPVFWLETFALWAFGISWMTKGEMIWKDALDDARTIHEAGPKHAG